MSTILTILNTLAMLISLIGLIIYHEAILKSFNDNLSEYLDGHVFTKPQVILIIFLLSLIPVINWFVAILIILIYLEKKK